jgi:hypothetical protein
MESKVRPQNPPSRASKGWQPQHRTRLFGSKAAALMTELRPLMGKRRQQQIDTAISGARTTRTPAT